MVRFKRVLLSAIVAVSLLASGCTLKQMIKAAEKQNLKVKPSPLEMHGNTVDFSLSATLPQNMLKPKTTYTVEVSYKPNNAEAMKVGEMQFDGNSNQRKMEKSFTFDYEDRLERGKLVLKGTARKGTKYKETPMMDVPGGDGIITTPELAMPAGSVNYVAHGYDGKEEYEPQNMEFFFLKNRSNLRWSEKRGDEAKKLEEYISQNNPTRTVTLTGMHSPEGPTKVNSKLAQERPETVEKFFKKKADKYDYKDQLGEISFVNKPVVENWSLFKELLNESTRFTDEQKSEILSIVNGPGDFVSKELKLQTLRSYRSLLKYIYPPLRTAKVEILKIKDKLTEPEIMAFAKQIMDGEESTDKLTDEELAYAADKTPLLTEKEKLYKEAISKNDAYYSYCNLGAVYLQMAAQKSSDSEKMSYVDKAINQFELSIKRRESPEAYVNLALANMHKGNSEEAMNALNKVGSARGRVGATVNALKGYLAIKEGNYDDAIQNLSAAGNDPMVVYNKGLAQLLKASKAMSGEYDMAKSTTQEAMNADSNSAYAYYVAAIIAARTNDADGVTSNIEKAASMNSMLKERAAKDLEFMSYWNDSNFMNALK